MPRYLVERTFPSGIGIGIDEAGAQKCLAIAETNADAGVTWVHSYVTDDRRKMICVYDAPSPEAVRLTASRNGLPVDSIAAVRVLDPYFYL